MQRITSVLLVPAVFYYGYLFIYPVESSTMLAFGLKLFILSTIAYHVILGLESVIEDYLHYKEYQFCLSILLKLSMIFIVKLLIESL